MTNPISNWKFVMPREKICCICGQSRLMHHNAHFCVDCKPEGIRRQARKFYHANVEEARRQRRENVAKNLERSMWSSAKCRAKAAGLDLTIAVEHVVIPTHCPYLGIALTKVFQKGEQDTSPSLDRKDNRLGYVPGNIEVISHRANRAKNNLNPKEAVLIARGFLERFQ